MSAMDANARLAHRGEMEVEAVVELGRKQLKLSAVRQLRPHAILALEKLAGEPFDLRLNDASFAACDEVDGAPAWDAGTHCEARRARQRPPLVRLLETGCPSVRLQETNTPKDTR